MSKAKRGTPLSPREREVLLCAAQGLSLEETSEQLGMSVETAKVHRKRLMAKLGVQNITRAVTLTMSTDEEFAEAIEK